jgi:hypothetical protein
MGLDMYLYRETFIGGEYDHRDVKGEVDITINGTPLDIDVQKISSIKEQVGYWRKAQQIHNWFVENVQDDEDNCAYYHVSQGQLIELLEEVNTVLSNRGTPQEAYVVNQHLPDGYDYDDEWYWLQMENTQKILTKILTDSKNPDMWVDYYYQSSW